jgi:hypothetical protein
VRRRSNLLDLVSFNQKGGRCEDISGTRIQQSAALIRVTGTADWAGVCTAETTGASPKTNDMPSFRIRLNAPER